MEPGRPSVDLVRQLVHICGTSWTHHRIVPMVPRTVAATGMEDCGAMVPFVWLPRKGRGEKAVVVAYATGLRLWVWDGQLAGYNCCFYARGKCGTARCRIGLISGSRLLFLAIKMTACI